MDICDLIKDEVTHPAAHEIARSITHRLHLIVTRKPHQKIATRVIFQHPEETMTVMVA